MKNIIEYYRIPNVITDIEKHKGILIKITDNPEFLCSLVQGLLLHDNGVEFYKTQFKEELQFHPINMEELIDEIIKIDSDYITTPRVPNKRVITSCREFATLSCALLRFKGISSRCRVGFPLYINVYDGFIAEHWVTEYWDGIKWVRIDTQIDAMQLSAFQRKGMIEIETICDGEMQYSFSNPHNLTDHDFIIAGRAWLNVRRGFTPAERFRYYHSSGLNYIKGELLRDFNALNKIEFQTHNVVINQGYNWNSWQLMSTPVTELSKRDYELLDYIAEISLDVDKHFDEIRTIFDNCSDLQIPQNILNNKRRISNKIPEQALLDVMD